MQEDQNIQSGIQVSRGYLVLATLVFTILLLMTSVYGEIVTNQCEAGEDIILENSCNITSLVSYNGTITNSAICHIKIFAPNGSAVFEYVRMENSEADGLYYYPFQFNVPEYYKATFICTENGVNQTESADYIIVFETIRDKIEWWSNAVSGNLEEVGEQVESEHRMTRDYTGNIADSTVDILWGHISNGLLITLISLLAILLIVLLWIRAHSPTGEEDVEEYGIFEEG